MEVGSPGTFIFVEAEVFVQRCSVKEVSLEISQNSQENTCVRVFNKVEGPFLYNTSGGCLFVELVHGRSQDLN